jgi:MFS family permease
VAGRLGDRHGQRRLLVPGAALSLLGMLAMAGTGSGLLVVTGAAVFGAGFGVLQNATLTLMYARVPRSEYSTVSAIWNGAYDLGMGVGASTVGALVAVTGYSGAFLVVAASMVPAVALARREARAGAGGSVHAAGLVHAAGPVQAAGGGVAGLDEPEIAEVAQHRADSIPVAVRENQEVVPVNMSTWVLSSEVTVGR